MIQFYQSLDNFMNKENKPSSQRKAKNVDKRHKKLPNRNLYSTVGLGSQINLMA